jgi:hypothetical protein
MVCTFSHTEIIFRQKEISKTWCYLSFWILIADRWYIFCADINLLEFKPSLIAASALLYASHELFPMQFLCFRKAISNCSHVNKVIF